VPARKFNFGVNARSRFILHILNQGNAKRGSATLQKQTIMGTPIPMSNKKEELPLWQQRPDSDESSYTRIGHLPMPQILPKWQSCLTSRELDAYHFMRSFSRSYQAINFQKIMKLDRSFKMKDLLLLPEKPKSQILSWQSAPKKQKLCDKLINNDDCKSQVAMK